MNLAYRLWWGVIGLITIAFAGPNQLSVKYKPTEFCRWTFACMDGPYGMGAQQAFSLYSDHLPHGSFVRHTQPVFQSSQQNKKSNDAGFFLRIFGAFGHGVLTAVQCGLVGGGLLPDLIDKNDPRWTDGFAAGFGFGYCLGSGLGAHWVGKKMGQHGSETAAIIGGFIGAYLAYEFGKDSKKGWGYIVGPPVMASLCFTIARPKAGQ